MTPWIFFLYVLAFGGACFVLIAFAFLGFVLFLKAVDKWNL